MHERVFNEAAIRLTIAPAGPILIKTGDSASPARPDMSFVRTFRNGEETVYLPGSSLKGVLRAHCERLARTADQGANQRRGGRQLACDPLHPRHSCGEHLSSLEKKEKEAARGEGKQFKEWSGARKHSESCFLCRIFGNTSLSSHFRITDAYPVGKYRKEERNGVAIDRVFGSVAVGPFNYETVTEGAFATTISLKNFTLAQLGLLALALRDLSLERVRLGFGKSRGLGLVSARVEELTLHYPLCELEGGSLRALGGKELRADRLHGVGSFIEPDAGYGYPSSDEVPLEGYSYASDDWVGVEARAPSLAGGGVDWEPLGRACARRWKAEVTSGDRG